MDRKQRRTFLSIIGIILILYGMGMVHVWNIASDYGRRHVAVQETIHRN